MLFTFFLIVLLLLLFVFRKSIADWLHSPSDPFADQLEEIRAEEKAVFGKRAVPPAASVGDPDVSKPKV